MNEVNETAARGLRKEREGVVVSNKMTKTIVVQVSRRIRHPVLGKELMQSRKFYAHDEKNEAKVGDQVRIVETRPLSRLKRWRLVEVLRKAS
jgi:small subunit ribosomal protein S17